MSAKREISQDRRNYMASRPGDLKVTPPAERRPTVSQAPQRPDNTMRLLDTVELTAPVGQWPAGTVGTIVDGPRETEAMVEVSDEQGVTLDTPIVPLDALRVVPPE